MLSCKDEQVQFVAFQFQLSKALEILKASMQIYSQPHAERGEKFANNVFKLHSRLHRNDSARFPQKVKMNFTEAIIILLMLLAVSFNCSTFQC